jgi:hypothetical protein
MPHHEPRFDGDKRGPITSGESAKVEREAAEMAKEPDISGLQAGIDMYLGRLADTPHYPPWNIAAVRMQVQGVLENEKGDHEKAHALARVLIHLRNDFGKLPQPEAVKGDELGMPDGPRLPPQTWREQINKLTAYIRSADNRKDFSFSNEQLTEFDRQAELFAEEADRGRRVATNLRALREISDRLSVEVINDPEREKRFDPIEQELKQDFHGTPDGLLRDVNMLLDKLQEAKFYPEPSIAYMRSLASGLCREAEAGANGALTELRRARAAVKIDYWEAIRTDTLPNPNTPEGRALIQRRKEVAEVHTDVMALIEKLRGATPEYSEMKLGALLERVETLSEQARRDMSKESTDALGELKRLRLDLDQEVQGEEVTGLDTFLRTPREREADHFSERVATYRELHSAIRNTAALLAGKEVDSIADIEQAVDAVPAGTLPDVHLAQLRAALGMLRRNEQLFHDARSDKERQREFVAQFGDEADRHVSTVSVILDSLRAGLPEYKEAQDRAKYETRKNAYDELLKEIRKLGKALFGNVFAPRETHAHAMQRLVKLMEDPAFLRVHRQWGIAEVDVHHVKLATNFIRDKSDAYARAKKDKDAQREFSNSFRLAECAVYVGEVAHALDILADNAEEMARWKLADKKYKELSDALAEVVKGITGEAGPLTLARVNEIETLLSANGTAIGALNFRRAVNYAQVLDGYLKTGEDQYGQIANVAHEVDDMLKALKHDVLGRHLYPK